LQSAEDVMATTLRGVRGAVVAAAFASMVLAGNVAAAPEPAANMAVARAAISDAVSAGGPEFAPIALRNAQDKLDRANAALSSGRDRDARHLAEEAEADARLAAATARAAKADRAVAEVQASLRALQEELARSGAR
jgi:hypothetical protein